MTESRDARQIVFAGLLLLAAACTPGLAYPSRFDYLNDAGASDAGDAGDSGPTDAGSPDAGSEDGGDAGEPDGGEDGGSDAGFDAGADGGIDGGVDGGEDGGTDAGVDGGCDPVALIFVPSCATAACHSRDTAQAGLDLESPDVLNRLIEIPSTEDPTGKLKLIDANSPDNSFLYLKVLPNPPYGSQMPFGLPALSSGDVACLQDWIHQSVGE